MTDYYHGEPCAKAGHTLRYRQSRQCVACTRAYQSDCKANNRKLAAQKRAEDSKDGVYYVGKPCAKFGHTLRYVKSNACVECNMSYPRKTERKPKEPRPVVVDTAFNSILQMRWSHEDDQV